MEEKMETLVLEEKPIEYLETEAADPFEKWVYNLAAEILEPKRSVSSEVQ
jgi:hypothetical protein